MIDKRPLFLSRLKFVDEPEKKETVPNIKQVLKLN